MPSAPERRHSYHAESKIIEGNLTLPLVQIVHPVGHAQHAGEAPGYKVIHSGEYRVKGVVSIASSYTHVAGNPITKPSGGWSTLSASVIEGLNILEVITADRVVGQIITEHPVEGYVPKISFLGTRFENLRIAGRPLELDLNLEILGAKPKGDKGYTKDSGVVGKVSSQYKRILGHKQVTDEVAKRFKELSAKLGKGDDLEASLINQVSGTFPGLSFGHVLHIPMIGTVTLAKLSVVHEDPHAKTGSPKKTTIKLTMLECKFGCAIEGALDVVGPSTNGGGKP
jgi:hypothetical protein